MRYEQSETLYRAYTYIHMYTNKDTRTHRDIIAYERQRQNQKGKKRDRQTGDICSLRVNLNLSFFLMCVCNGFANGFREKKLIANHLYVHANTDT